MVELLTLTLDAFLSILNKHWIYTCAWPWSWIPTIFFGQPKTRKLRQQDGIAVVQAFYTFYIAILLDLEEKLYRESLNYIQKKTALWKNLWELGIMSYCWKRSKQLVTRGTLSKKYEKGGLRSALHSCNALWTQQLSTKSKLLRSTWIEKKKLKSIWKNSTCTASIPPSHFFLVIPS